LIGTIASILDRLLLGLFTNLQTLGVYSVAGRFVDILAALHAALKMAYGPFLMKSLSARSREALRVVVAVTPFYTIPYFAFGVGLAIFIDPVIRLVGQPAYIGVEAIVPWLVGVQVLSYVTVYFANGITLGKRTELLSIPAAVNLVVMAALSVVLIAPFQLAGIIASRYGAALAFLGVNIYLSQKVFPISHQWSTVFRLAGAAVLFTAFGRLVLEPGSPWEVPTKTCLWAIYVGLAWWIAKRGSPSASPSTSHSPA
jgi:O-antigen/teichoic acid export membrane protein